MAERAQSQNHPHDNRNPDIIMFGGAFDPPHLGHEACVRAALSAIPASSVVVVPGKVPASAAGVGKLVATDFSDRLAMCELAFKSLGESRVFVDPLEAELPAPNYTLRTLTELAEKHPGSRLGLLIGHDNFSKFTQWQDPLKILEIADILVARRDTLAAGAELRQMAIAVLNELGLKAEWNAARTEAKFPGCAGKLFLLPEVAHPAESSKFRAGANDRADKSWLNEDVFSYAEKHGLYNKR